VECGVVEDEYHFFVVCEKGRVAREILMREIEELGIGEES